MLELLEWHDASSEQPDADLTVLCWDDEGMFCGYWDDSVPGWISCESGGVVDGVTHWSSPEGPASTLLAPGELPALLRRQAG